MSATAALYDSAYVCLCLLVGGGRRWGATVVTVRAPIDSAGGARLANVARTDSNRKLLLAAQRKITVASYKAAWQG